jgi:hypothetical protein
VTATPRATQCPELPTLARRETGLRAMQTKSKARLCSRVLGSEADQASKRRVRAREERRRSRVLAEGIRAPCPRCRSSGIPEVPPRARGRPVQVATSCGRLLQRLVGRRTTPTSTLRRLMSSRRHACYVHEAGPACRSEKWRNTLFRNAWSYLDNYVVPRSTPERAVQVLLIPEDIFETAQIHRHAVE